MKQVSSLLVILLILTHFLSVGTPVGATSLMAETPKKVPIEKNIETAFKSRYSLQTASFVGTTPEIVEVEIPSTLGIADMYLVDANTNEAQAYASRLKSQLNDLNYSITWDGRVRTQLTDADVSTGIDIPVSSADATQQFAEFEIKLDKPARVNGLRIALDPLSKPPQLITIKGTKNQSSTNTEQIVFVNQLSYQPTLQFPAQEVDSLVVTFAYSQTLRFTEVSLVQPNSEQSTQHYLVRFLAKPATNYVLYVQPDAQQSIKKPLLESGDLFSKSVVKKLAVPTLESNPLYTAADGDSDGFIDATDNCPEIFNPEQTDKNMNGVGDDCEDFDADRILNFYDNCPESANAAQTDVDGDGLGDACDGQESRFTEQNPWLPWVAIAITGVTIGGLFYSVSKSKKFVSNK